jgi:hypothetical protein
LFVPGYCHPAKRNTLYDITLIDFAGTSSGKFIGKYFLTGT